MNYICFALERFTQIAKWIEIMTMSTFQNSMDLSVTKWSKELIENNPKMFIIVYKKDESWVYCDYQSKVKLVTVIEATLRLLFQ